MEILEWGIVIYRSLYLINAVVPGAFECFTYISLKRRGTGFTARTQELPSNKFNLVSSVTLIFPYDWFLSSIERKIAGQLCSGVLQTIQDKKGWYCILLDLQIKYTWRGGRWYSTKAFPGGAFRTLVLVWNSFQVCTNILSLDVIPFRAFSIDVGEITSDSLENSKSVCS